MPEQLFFNIDSAVGGIPRELAPGITTTIFSGAHAQISIVRFEANAEGTLHHHPEEQWGHCLAGSGVRYQGDEAVAVKPGDFWRTPSGLPHTMKAGEEGMVVMDIFSPPRTAYETPGSGFAAA